MAQEQEASAADATGVASPVPSLVTLCLQAIGRHLKHFCNLRLHGAAHEELSTTERQLIHAYDLSRLDLFEAQAFLPLIAAWRSQMHRKKMQASRARYINRSHHSNENPVEILPPYVLLPPVSLESGVDPLCSLKTTLGLSPVSGMELRLAKMPSSAVRDRPEWVSDVGGDATDNEMAAELAKKLNVDSPEDEPGSAISKVLPGIGEIIRFRSPVTNVGCGIVASMLRDSTTLVQLRLNSCQVTDAGVILLASAMRTTSTLRVFDLSNDPFPSRRDKPMDNVIGSVGTRSIALALEENQSVEYIDLSGNSIGEDGALALAKMLPKNTSLRRLNLERTQIQDAADALIDAFESSASLKSLNLRWCALRPGLGVKLTAAHGATSAA